MSLPRESPTWEPWEACPVCRSSHLCTWVCCVSQGSQGNPCPVGLITPSRAQSLQGLTWLFPTPILPPCSLPHLSFSPQPRPPPPCLPEPASAQAQALHLQGSHWFTLPRPSTHSGARSLLKGHLGNRPSLTTQPSTPSHLGLTHHTSGPSGALDGLSASVQSKGSGETGDVRAGPTRWPCGFAPGRLVVNVLPRAPQAQDCPEGPRALPHGSCVCVWVQGPPFLSWGARVGDGAGSPGASGNRGRTGPGQLLHKGKILVSQGSLNQRRRPHTHWLKKREVIFHNFCKYIHSWWLSRWRPSVVPSPGLVTGPHHTVSGSIGVVLCREGNRSQRACGGGP